MPGFHLSKVAGARYFCLLAMALCAISPMPVHAATPNEVDDALDKAVAFLLSQQHKDGSWEPADMPAAAGRNIAWGGKTAIATYALLSAGKNSYDPSLRKAIEWLGKEDLHGTYAVALRSLVWGQLQWRLQKDKNKAALAARDRDRDFLLYSRIPHGPNAGFYSYKYGEALPSGGFAPIDPKGPNGSACDLSNSQFALLGMWAVEQAGAEVPTQYWLDEDQAWKKAQLPDGGWEYAPGNHGAATETMTCAGLSSLFIIQDYLLRTNLHQFDTCAGGIPNVEINKGLAWLDQRFRLGPAARGAISMYGWHGISRVGIASGRRYFGGVDWYRTGAETIVRSQKPDGSWGSTDDTAFAMLFLTTSRSPLLFQKLQYASATQNEAWNERPRDVANLSKWVGWHALCGYLSWQMVSLDSPADDLHDAPVLFIAGSEALQFGDKQIAKLRAFIEEGGTILGNADCEQEAFVTSFKQLGQKLFPKYEFRKLPPSHPIFTEMYLAAKWKRHPQVEAMSNGVRELMIISPDTDLAKAWQIEATKSREECFQLATNIFLYTCGKENLSSRGTTYMVHADSTPAREIKLARIQVGENWDPEPGAWRRMSAVMHNEHHLDIKAEPVALGQSRLAEYKLASLTGTTAFQLSDTQRKEIKDFVDKGGTLIVDAAGGAAEFADAAWAELTQIFGQAASKSLEQPLPFTHAFFAEPKIEKIRYRNFARHLLHGSTREPHLRAISRPDGHIGVFFSREDITAGLVGEEMDGIIGYTPTVATQLMENMILYSEKNR